MESYTKQVPWYKASLYRDKKPLLNVLTMELTERCNNDCIHCCINLPADDQAARERELSTAKIMAVLTEAASLGCMTVRYTGGEPLLREDFEELYLFARGVGLGVTLFTNATLITPHLADLLAKFPPRERIEITIYGMKRKSYEAVSRVPGSFEAAWRGIHLLLEREVPFVVKGALLPPNRDEVDEFDAWVATTPWMDRPPKYVVFFDLRSRRDSVHHSDAAKNRLIKRLRPSPEEGFDVLARRPESYLKNMKESYSMFTRLPGDILFTCSAGQGGGCVDAYGKFQPCMPLRHPETVYDLTVPSPSTPGFDTLRYSSIGAARPANMVEGGLGEALTNFIPRLRELRATNPDYLARCARCFLKRMCRHCPAKSWAEHGTLDTPVEYFCQVAHAQARYMGLIAEGEKAWEVGDWNERIRDFCGKKPASGNERRRGKVLQNTK
jgi:MoaA/NifB/PqqE/SkfB family radical SAM enzyme